MSRPHLILVPGLMCDATVWKHQAASLETFAGISIPDHADIDSLGKMADAILDDAPNRFALAGHSMGGRVALEVFRRAPERIAGIALMDTGYAPLPGGVDGEREAAGRYALLETARREGMRAMGMQWAPPMVHPDRRSDAVLMKAILDMIERKTPHIFAAQIKALLNRPDAAPLLSQIHCPALVLCGRDDSWSGPAQHEEMAQMIAHSKLTVIENCGHMSTMERPEEVTDALRRWMETM
jgi:pimeloyl-ACP methyl ester carboxylesterase